MDLVDRALVAAEGLARIDADFEETLELLAGAAEGLREAATKADLRSAFALAR